MSVCVCTQDINSPLRHVRTRIYFTSESHVHSLINVLRYAHIGVPLHHFRAVAGSMSFDVSMQGGGFPAAHSFVRASMSGVWLMHITHVRDPC